MYWLGAMPELGGPAREVKQRVRNTVDFHRSVKLKFFDTVDHTKIMFKSVIIQIKGCSLSHPASLKILKLKVGKASKVAK